ncbi:MAG: hypothetical protein KGZ25_01585, partial [Planctomycetes bacterium]|nr:hypothetical protein [Planctomycetota bacterium]
NHVFSSSRIHQIRSSGANAARVGGDVQWVNLPDKGDDRHPPDGWHLIGLWGAGGGANGCWGDPPYGSSLMAPESSTLNITYTAGGAPFGPNIYFRGTDSNGYRIPIAGFYGDQP